MFSPTNIPFNQAEVAIHKKLGIAEQLHAQVSEFIRAEMPRQHRDFYQSLPMVILGLSDKTGNIWATPTFGQQGFINTLSNTQLAIDSKLLLGKSVDFDLRAGAKVGMLGIELSTRRRNRVNGVVSDKTAITDSTSKLVFNVDQSYGNCPKYIQKHEFNLDLGKLNSFQVNGYPIEHSLSQQAAKFIEQADTFYIASRSRTFSEDPRSGIDASHRGGKPGFVKVLGDRLMFPDFSGNRFFNTVGNIEDDGRVGLFFPDLVTGDAFFISGRAKIHWDKSLTEQYQGAERFIEVECLQVIYAKAVIPFQSKLLERSPFLTDTGDWQSTDSETGQVQSSDNRYQPYVLTNKVAESPSITSFYLSPKGTSTTEGFSAGQFLPIRLTDPETGEKLQRSYTLSQLSSKESLNKESYRISVKREQHGKVSCFLHDQLKVGDDVEAAKPAGNFGLAQQPHSAVMISAGVGITPIIAMLEQRILEAQSQSIPMPVHVYHACKNIEEFAFAKYLNTLAKQYSWLKLHVVFSASNPKHNLEHQNYSNERLSVVSLKANLPFDNHHYYLCGSEGFMRDFYQGLVAMGVAKSHIHYEFFGAGSIEPKTNSIDEKPAMALPKQASINFSLSQKKATWKQGNLLEFAEKQGLSPNSSCRSGNCGSCEVKLLKGQVQYQSPPEYTPPEGHALLCCALPLGDSEIVIEL
jgi:ferredoxin-NADP reductase/predicted pyridoxine 5'-phosphate oxidase superfamily flavin-nucleotide-binding protein